MKGSIITDIIGFFSFLKPSHWKGIFSVRCIFHNYFWLITLTAIMHLYIGKSWLYTITFPILTVVMIWKTRRCIKFNAIDFLWIVGIVWIFMTWLYNDYPNKSNLIFKCLQTQITFMLAYWIGRFDLSDNLRKIITCSYKPLVIMCIIGILFFLNPPSWYNSAIEEYLYNTYGNDYTYESALEFYRLRSIFPTTYSLTYFANIVLIFLWFCLIQGKKIKGRSSYLYAFIFLLLITSVLAMMRAPTMCSLLSLFVAVIYGMKYKNVGSTTVKVILAVSIVILIGIFIINNVSSSLLEFLSEKITSVTSSNSDLVNTRLKAVNYNYSLLGDGVGRHSIYTSLSQCIPDAEYIKLIVEQGYIGFAIFVAIFAVGTIKAIKHFKYLYLELCLIIMVLICMIGADPISTYDKHPFLFWLALGQISAYRNIDIYNKQKI
jgi:hypothetical protein